MELSKGWKKIPLKEVLDYEQPNPYIIEKQIIQDNSLIPVLTPGKSFIKGYTAETKGIFKETPVIIFDDFTTSSKYVNFPFKVKSSAMKILKTKDKNMPLKFIFYQMHLIDINTTTHKRQYLSTYQNLEFLFPIKENGEIDINRQILIVEEIEKQLTRLDKNIQNLNIVRGKLEIYKKSILKKAFKDCTNWIKIGKVVDMQSGHAFKKEEYSKEGARLFQIANVTFGKTIWEKTAYLPKNYLNKYSQLKLNKGDILMALNRPLLNHELKIAILNESDLPSILYQRVGRFIFLKEENQKFFFYYLRSLYFIQQLEKTLQGVNIPFINKSNLMNFEYPKFSLKTQKKIVQEIESKFSMINNVEEIIKKSLLRSEQFRKSILKKAFEGKLPNLMEIKIKK